ncbi:hypothetical protein PHJA_000407200 [Phtheirospermum japonicum]|uniref:DUF7792 domain-containing protein n=1 Tax=Phtheirospermum japonicum TaxID=374723 RepID=A0A830BKM8_9LAMI|nr:hypothetical protein PHJA_000407200 [Phtheirospermum japonicum]
MAAKPTSSATQPPAAHLQQLSQKPVPIDQQLQQEKRIEHILSFPILLSDQINQTVKEAKIFKSECAEVGKRVDRLLQMLRSAARLVTSAAAFYDRPLRRVAVGVSNNLHKSLTVVRKCRRRSLFRRVVTIFSAADFRKLLGLLDSSVADMDWVLSILEAGGGPTGGIILTLPPIASTDPIISWVWSFIASLYMAQPQDKIEAANQLASLAKDNDRNKQIIVEEGGILPLLRLLKDNFSLEGQIAAAYALHSLVNNVDSVRAIVNASGVTIIVQVLSNSSIKVQISAASLVAKMAEHCSLAKEDFARENVIRPLVLLLSYDLPMEDFNLKSSRQSLHSLVHKEIKMKNLDKESNISNGGIYRKEIENENPETKLGLKISCAEALWMLAKNSVANSTRITETKGLLCLAKLVETENGELRYNCLMAIMEITAVAESNADLRRAAFKTNSPAAKAVVDQLLSLTKDSNDDPRLSVAAVRAIGCLARTFPARETRVIIGPLVEQLSNKNLDVATEAVVSLGKFACPENFLCVEHSKRIIEFGGVIPLMRLLRGNERALLHGLVLVCYLAIHVGKSEDLERAGVLSALEGVDRGVIARHSELRELMPKAVYHLSVFHQSHSGVLPQKPSLAH